VLRTKDNDKKSAYATCPNGTAPIIQLNDGNDVYTATDANTHKTTIANSLYLPVSSGVCYAPCPDRTEITPFDKDGKGQNAKNYTQCRDVCPASESFYDGGLQCYKIAAQRDEPQATATNSFLQDNIETSSNLTKFAYYGGVSTLWGIAAIVVAVGIFTALILLAKRRHWVKSTTYFVN
jgi:hypothetical protein